jgi:hypothetical protein
LGSYARIFRQQSDTMEVDEAFDLNGIFPAP